MLANKTKKCWQIKNWLQQGSNLGARGESQRALPLRYSSMFGCTRAHFYLNQIQLMFFSIPPPSPCSFLNPLIPSRADSVLLLPISGILWRGERWRW